MSDISKAVESLSSKQRAMFEALMEKKRQQRQSAKVGTQIPRRGEMDAIPLSFSQQRLWFLDQLAPGNPAYNMDRAIRLSGSLDVAALERSLNEVLRRHEVLRTTFSSRKGQPVQVITPELMLALPVVDLRALAGAEQQARMWQLVTEEAQRPFDLARDPLLRAALLRLAETEHVMLLTMHHIASDGWSMGILVRELMALYEGYVAGQPLPLPELPIQYADYAVWQRDWLQGAAFEEKLGYWKSQLDGAPAVVELPLDHPRPPVQSSRGARLSFPLLSAPLTDELKALGQRAGVTLFMTLLAAFDVLVYRYTGEADVVVGTPVANRNRKELEGLIGFFVNTLVLRTDLSGNPTFRELLERVRQVTSGAFAQQDFPFEMLVEELQPRRDLSRNPLFQVMFALQNAPTPALEMAGLTLSPLDVDDGMARFDLLVSVWDVEQGLLGSFEYNTDLFEATTITRLAGHFQTLLQGIVATPEQPICDLPLLTEAERQQVLVEWNNTTTDYGQTRCIHELFEAQVEQTPDATALVFPSTGFARHPERSEWTGHSQHHHLTYRELNRRANQLAHHLRALGVGPETRVGICVERSPEMVVGLYGILKAGAAYVPLDPAYPVERLAFMLADAQVPVLLTQEALASKLPPHQAQVLCLDADWAIIARQSAHNPTVRLVDENLAYVIYTSGSTGRPKGAMNTHGGIRNRLLWMQEAYQLGPADRVIQKTPFSFDVSVWEFFWPLLYGACLVVARPEGHKDSAYLIQTIVEQHVTTMHFVPSMLQMFVDERGVEACRSLKRVICSGEALPFDLTQRFFACLEAELHNLYGPTEAAVDVTFWPCQRESERRVVPIGRPIANTQIYLLDAHLMPVPVGVPGELHIGGAGLARGYHHRPGLTAERFIPAPSFACSSGGETAARLYKTGDLARYLPHGDIEFLGRTDFQVKVRGFRIELGETEAVLGEHPAIRETVVVAAPVTPADGAGDGRAASWDSRLVAYVVPNQGQELLVDELRRFMLEKLPEYMAPSVFVTLEALPLSPNGKVDRRALPAPDGARPEMETVYVAPRGEAERAIAAIWREVLRVEQVGINDNFFDLGGHSLLVVQVHHQLTATFEKEFPMTDMFKYTTVAALAQHLSQAQEQTDIVQKTKERAAARRASLRRRARSR